MYICCSIKLRALLHGTRTFPCSGGSAPLSNRGFFSALPAGVRGERISGDTPETPPGAAAPEPRCKKSTLESQVPIPTYIPLSPLQFPTFRLNNVRDTLYECRERCCSKVLVGAQADGYGVCLGFFVANHKHVRNLLELRIAHFGVHTLAACIYLGPHSHCFERLQHLISIFLVPIGNRNDHGLHRRQPYRECTGVMLDQHCHKTFRRTGNRAVDHDRAMRLTILADVLELEVLRLHEIKLHRRTLPVTTQ